jgi:hypothetical protein
MLTVLFWNTGRNAVLDPLVEMCAERGVDVVVLAESAMSLGGLLPRLFQATGRTYVSASVIFSGKIQMLTALPLGSFRPTMDGADYSFVHFEPPLGPSVLIGGVHLPSRLAMSREDQVFEAIRMREAVNQAEETVMHSRTILIGDFNMNPFDLGLVGADAFHAVCDRRIALRGARTVRGAQRKFFYNPMWNLFGDVGPHPPASYYYANGGHHVQFWEMFDQCLVRPDLLSFLPETGVELLTSTRNHALADENGRPRAREYSDHFPLLLKLNQGITNP